MRAGARTPWLVLGIGLGGFVDGIVLHQVLQWHHLVSASTPPATLDALERNTLADGFFHAATWVTVLAGVLGLAAAWRSGAAPVGRRAQAGLLLAGWGLFDLVEGVVDHHLLQVHHVRDDLGGPLSWDLGFLALGLAQLVAGLLLARTDRQPTRVRGG